MLHNRKSKTLYKKYKNFVVDILLADFPKKKNVYGIQTFLIQTGVAFCKWHQQFLEFTFTLNFTDIVKF